MSIQIKCDSCDEIIDTGKVPWFEVSEFDPNAKPAESDIEAMLGAEVESVIFHFCTPSCVSAWGYARAMDKWPGSVL